VAVPFFSLFALGVVAARYPGIVSGPPAETGKLGPAAAIGRTRPTG
jgi:hypothetical protein